MTLFIALELGTMWKKDLGVSATCASFSSLIGIPIVLVMISTSKLPYVSAMVIESYALIW